MSKRSPEQLSTLVELLRWRALQQPERQAYTFLMDKEQKEVHLTYGQLDRKARAIAALLQSLGTMGVRALLLHPPGLDYIAALFGCLYAKVIAIPAYPPHPARIDRTLPRLQAIVKDAGATLALTTQPILSSMESLASGQRGLVQAEELASLRWIATDDMEDGLEDGWKEPSITSETLAYLQYSSGSTGTPKGIMISHGNVMHNSALIQEGWQFPPDGEMVSWLPMYHDMGLVGGVLNPFCNGYHSTLMSPSSFLKGPLRWLQVISRIKDRPIVSGAPNFAYDLCVHKITSKKRETLELSNWCVAFNGAEPVRMETLERFTKTFEPCGFRCEAFWPCYGLAEATLCVSGGQKTKPPIIHKVNKAALANNHVVDACKDDEGACTLVGCGQALLNQAIAIVDPASLTRCSPDQIGEIWVSGPSVAQGYWNRPEETESTFQAHLADTGEGPFLRTGDLGYLRNGELFITGRLKDLIIIRGSNHYPQDIELTAEKSHEALRPGGVAAFSVDIVCIDGEEQLVVVQEVNPRRGLGLDAVIGAIRQAVAEMHEIQVYAVVLIKPRTIPKTSSGKIQRRACQKAFIEGKLEIVKEWRATIPQERRTEKTFSNDTLENAKGASDRDELTKSPNSGIIETWLVSHLAEMLGIDRNEIDRRQPFASFGLDSAQAVSLIGDLEAWLGRLLSPTLAWEFPTVEALARHLVGEATTPASVYKIDTPRNLDSEPIAIIGLGCRFPRAEDPEAFWHLLRDGVDAITEVPTDRWDVNAFYDLNPVTPGKMNTRWGGFLEHVDLFDPYFFGISPREAGSMDPQQRLVLEVSWEALENAGQAAEKLAGSQVGVFIGISTNDYSQRQFSDPAAIDAYAGTGNALSIAANRLSYLLDLRGPSLAVDTACSSSLVAVHYADQSLRSGECSLALAGGVNLMLSPELTITFSQARMMASDGRCKTFDAEADGYVRGEGCGIVVLKRLSDALKERDTILAVVRGSAINQDGRSNGLTAPSGAAQQAVIRQALENARLSPDQICYVETHGTGTPLGDPIEFRALAAVLGEGRAPDQPCVLGSVKTNIGHLEAAAGIAGLIKAVLLLQNEEIPPHLHLKKINPHLPLKNTPFVIATERRSLPQGTKPRFVGVSSFGFGGTNAYVVLEEAPISELAQVEVERPQHLLTLSGKTEEALKQVAVRYADYLAANPSLALADFCFSANTGRSHFNHRLSVVAGSATQARKKLAAFIAGQEPTGVFKGQVLSINKPKLAFLFTGQGSQYIGMGHQLYETQPSFRQVLGRCDEILRPYLERSLVEVLYSKSGETSPLDETAYTQPALFALEYALAQLWKSWDIEPSVIMGHSVGEYVAACVAGVFSLEDGLKLIAERGRLMRNLPEEGEMVVVFADEARITAAIQPYAREVSIAALNGPQNTVISGRREAVEAVVAAMHAEEVKTIKLTVSHAFHSALMEPMLVAFEQVASKVTYSSPQIGLISNVTGELVAPAEIMTPEYWCRHIRQPVRFAASMQSMRQLGVEVFLEIGPQPTLLEMGHHCLPEGAGVWLPSLRQGQSDWQQLLRSLGELYRRGVQVNWLAFDQDYARRRIALPTYPWQRSRYWMEITTNAHQKVASLSQEDTQTPIVQLLNRGDTKQLIQQLEKARNFSGEQIKLLSELLEVLVEQHQQQLKAARTKEWFYQLDWQLKPRGLKTAREEIGFHQPGSWLILADRTGVGQALSELLQGRGQNCVLVYAAEACCQSKETATRSINPAVLAEFEALFRYLLRDRALPPLRGIVHLWSLEAALPGELTIPSLEQAQTWGCGSVLHLVQILVKHSVSPRLWLVTRGAVPAGYRHPLAVAQAPLWGLGKVVALEHPQLWGGMLDLAPDATSDEAAMLLEEIWDSQGENQLAIRDGQRYVARLVRISQPTPQEVQLQPDGTYLITGGLGNLGLRVARWMVEQGARHLVLTGRRRASMQAEKLLSELERAGARVLVTRADVANQEDMVRALEEINASWPPLRGIIHAAGVLDDGILLQQNRERLTRVMAPKVNGAWNLHVLTQNLALDFLVLFSSAASLLGSPGQANYAAANTFLDALAHHRQFLGQPGLSLNWGQWAEAGMAASLGDRHQARLVAQGLSPIAPEQGLQVLKQVLKQAHAQIGVLPIDWSVFREQFPAGMPLSLLSELVPKAGSQEEAKQVSEQQHKLLQRLKRATASDRKELLVAYVQERITKILGLESSFRPAPQQSLNEFGFDSLMSTQLKNRFISELGVDMPIKEFIKGVSIAQLVGLLLDHLTLSSVALSEPPSSDVSDITEDMEEIVL
jgi:Polyketide synthase modules and related proteins